MFLGTTTTETHMHYICAKAETAEQENNHDKSYSPSAQGQRKPAEWSKIEGTQAGHDFVFRM